MQADEDIRSILSRTPEHIPAFTPDLGRVAERARSRRLRKGVGATLAIAALVAGIVLPLGLLGGLRPVDEGERAVPRGRPVILDRIPVEAGAVDLTVGEGSVWVTGFNDVSRVDPASDEVVATIRTPETGDYSSVAVGEGAVWVTTSNGSLYRIDPTTNRVEETIQVGYSPTNVTVGGGSVWVSVASAGSGSIVRVDPRTNEVVGSPIAVGEGPGPAVFVDGSLWVTNTSLIVGEGDKGTELSGPSLVRVDPATGMVTPVGGPVASVTAYGAGALWGVAFVRPSSPSTVEGDAVVRLAPDANRVTDVIPLDLAQEVAFGEGFVWVLTTPPSTDPTLFIPDPDNPGTVVLIDPATGKPTAEPLPVPGLQPLSIAVGKGSGWVADYDGSTVTRIGIVP